MSLPFSFAGRMRPLTYAVWSFGAFFSPHLIALLVLGAQGHSFAAVTADGRFYVMPLQMLARHSGARDVTLILALGYLLVTAWALAALASRRAADAHVNGWLKRTVPASDPGRGSRCRPSARFSAALARPGRSRPVRSRRLGEARSRIEDYSYLRAMAGSTVVARRAGMYTATSAASARIPATAPNVSGSPAFTPNSRLASSRVAP